MADSDQSKGAPDQNSDARSQPSVWPPPPTAPDFAQQEDENTSGLRRGVPQQVAAYKWNWGAFLLPFWWCISHRLYGFALASVVTVVVVATSLVGISSTVGSGAATVGAIATFGLYVYLGMKGHRLAWENRWFEGGIKQYREVQTIWMWCGIVLAIIYVLLGIWVWQWIKFLSSPGFA
jgi:hypothetical protein